MEKILTGNEEQVLQQLKSLPRSGDHAFKVKKILESCVDTAIQIERIQKLDAVYSLPSVGNSDITPGELRKLMKDPGIITSEKASQIFENIKRKNIRQRHVLFWGDRGKIKDFARESDLLKVGLFPSSLRFTKSALTYLEELQESARIMLPVMISILKVAWAYISKSDFNLLQKFKKMCEELLVLDKNRIVSHRDTLLIPLLELEKYVLFCHYRPEYPQIIQSSIQNIFNKYPDWSSKIKNVDNHLMNLLDISRRKHSILYIILAANTAYYGRYCSVMSLTNSVNGEIINSFDHDCEPEIKNKIQDFISKRIKMLEELMATREKINLTKTYIDQFLQKEEDGSYKQKPLIEFYKSGEGVQVNFAADTKNISTFASHLLKRFLLTLWNILIGYLELERIDKTKVFDDSLFQDHFVRIKSLSERFENAFFTKHNFSQERFEELKRKSSASMSNTEAEILQVLDSFSQEVMSIGKKLAAISLKHEVRGSADQWTALSPKDLNSTTIEIPFWDYIITQESYFKGWKFSNTINFIISVCFLIGLLFYDNEFAIMLQKERLINTKVDDVMLILERICDPVQFERIKRSL